jgi:hypothetical protein
MEAPAAAQSKESMNKAVCQEVYQEDTLRILAGDVYCQENILRLFWPGMYTHPASGRQPHAGHTEKTEFGH